MERPIKVSFQGEIVDGTELEFETIHEGWNEYACADGTNVKLKNVVVKVIRLDKTGADGEPIYMTRSNNVLSVSGSVRRPPTS